MESVAKVLLCLEEAGAKYELVPVDMAAREQKAPHHLARNVEVGAHQFHRPASAVVLECVFAPLLRRARDQAAVDENVAKLRTVLEVYDARLKGQNCRYLAGGDDVSLADLTHFSLDALPDGRHRMKHKGRKERDKKAQNRTSCDLRLV
ncbi:hypothetical protein PR202_gb24881 [Eleusine coracana subsp. coracana]|uniref:glutathione transferase n=1 Tax=Eleusine coracana subsp. coracana TaxID=191504 RepID=A0AAV5FNL2_ELECO|nr:hypothetical protein PR202_gb24881 [Eleusine coracana subsp. coracana]